MDDKDKTISALHLELSALRLRNAELEALEVKHRLMEKQLMDQAHQLRERIKEINCLYGISRLVEQSQTSLSRIYQGIVDLIPASWQYPDITTAQLVINGQFHATFSHRDSPWSQSVDVVVHGKQVGKLIVSYQEERPPCQEGPFLTEERSLLNAIGERLGRITEQKQMETALREQAHDLRERIKEINCLYGISRLVENTDKALEEIYQGIVELLPHSWQYPAITSAQLSINGQNYRTDNHKDSKWKQSADIIAYGEKIGVLAVCYQEERPDCFAGPFLKEECSLLDAVAERLGRITEQKQSEKSLNESRIQLKSQNLLLQDKNIALREIMEQVLTEKKNLEERVLANVDRLLLPLIRKLKNRDARMEKQYIHLLEENLLALTSQFGSKISRIIPKLTPRENEICNMIRSGLSSKEIAAVLNISFRSVETYRNFIRKKLGITHKKVNLTSFFASLEEKPVHAE
ncbi:MAG: LuxR C-terminal-related transcriptional regulator [Pseudomonadota bacterium]